MNKKKSYFLSIDAFIAIVIIIFGFIVISSQFEYETYTVQHEIFSRDFMESLILPLPDYNVDHHPNLGKYKEKGYFHDYSMSLMEHIVRFVILNQTGKCDDCFERAHNLTKEIVEGRLPRAFSINITINNGTIYEIYSNVSARSNFETARTVTTSRKMITVVEDDQFYPFIARVIVWS